MRRAGVLFGLAWIVGCVPASAQRAVLPAAAPASLNPAGAAGSLLTPAQQPGLAPALSVGTGLAPVLRTPASPGIQPVPAPAGVPVEPRSAAGVAARAYAAQELPSPKGFFEHAKAAALARAASKGYGPQQVFLGEATASLPVRDGRGWHFTFYFMSHFGQSHADQLTVIFQEATLGRTGGEVEVADDPSRPSSLRRRYAVREILHESAPIPPRRFPARLDDAFFAAGSTLNPDQALAKLRSVTRRVGHRVSLSFRMRRPDATGAQDLWYYVFDEGGAQFVVNGRTGEILERFRVAR